MPQRLPKVLAGIALAVVAAASAACSSSSSPPTSGTSPSGVATTPTPTTAKAANFNSCSVVTQSDASSAIGESMSSGVLGHATVEGGLACVFYGPSAPKPHDPDVAQPDSVRVVVVKGPNALKWYDA